MVLPSSIFLRKLKGSGGPASFYFVMELTKHTKLLLFLKEAKRREWASPSIFLRKFNGAKTRWSCLLLSF